jgi:hypothetical protein
VKSNAPTSATAAPGSRWTSIRAARYGSGATSLR